MDFKALDNWEACAEWLRGVAQGYVRKHLTDEKYREFLDIYLEPTLTGILSNPRIRNMYENRAREAVRAKGLQDCDFWSELCAAMMDSTVGEFERHFGPMQKPDTCESCVGQCGKPAEVGPHGALRLVHSELGTNFDEEQWECDKCGKRFFRRSVGSILYRGPLGVWERY